ncbi:hypothetical protein [Actinomadura sp. WMMB 499]|uniref:hypothetical protein n=1 Tax=Actinomadura sp. WMMB 499 TaxID=1219491 RepID=UPI001247C1F9|nr:hypothetical protein [Actinomadura sp. WMMB 499]QFG25750.1 hypothetical protein F7P10_36030 [Actinomadura sp. WMMB 499]
MKPRNPRSIRAPRRRMPVRHGAARIGLVAAAATVLCVLAAGPALAAEEGAGSSAVVTGVIIVVGALIGIGIGLAIVSRAARGHTRDRGKGGPR